MIAKQLFGIVILSLCVTHFVSGQTRMITGTIKEREDGSALAGVSVVAKVSNTGTLTDSSGNFKIVVPATERSLVISHIGFVAQTIDITRESNVDVLLVSGIASLDEAIVTGYGTSKRKDITGAVES